MTKMEVVGAVCVAVSWYLALEGGFRGARWVSEGNDPGGSWSKASTMIILSIPIGLFGIAVMVWWG